ncbi:hypothetical protein L3Y34_007524 [Caenorhabditis briggsae]|uniref:Uncharacterized protein n=1 Tax=Caenorhabditis briggsae TaxID=6238 RepID=A0AAE9A2R3_CAEBR|nr:hypothetical protein L3Y34_007524 [Caenorhabditis briggsae]
MKVLIAVIALVGCSVYAQQAQILPAGNQGNMGNQGGQGNMGNQGRIIGNQCYGRNEEMKQCGTACEPTCANRNPVLIKQSLLSLSEKKKVETQRKSVCVSTLCVLFRLSASISLPYSDCKKYSLNNLFFLRQA